MKANATPNVMATYGTAKKYNAPLAYKLDGTATKVYAV